MSDDAPRPLPKLPGGPDPERPVPRTPVLGVSLVTYAALAAELAARPGERAALLARMQMDEVDWQEVESTWLLRIAATAMQSDMTLRELHDRAYADAQDRLYGADAPRLSLETYAAAVARQASGAHVADVLVLTGLTLPLWLREQTLWGRKLVRDAELASRLRALVTAAESGAPPSAAPATVRGVLERS